MDDTCPNCGSYDTKKNPYNETICDNCGYEESFDEETEELQLQKNLYALTY